MSRKNRPMVTTFYPGTRPPRRKPVFEVWTDADRRVGTSEAGAWLALLVSMAVVLLGLAFLAIGPVGAGGAHPEKGQFQYQEREQRGR